MNSFELPIGNIIIWDKNESFFESIKRCFSIFGMYYVYAVFGMLCIVLYMYMYVRCTKIYVLILTIIF